MLTFFDEADDVFDHDDRVIDHEPGRNRQRHEREIIEAVTEQPHDAECAGERQRHGDAGDERRPETAQKNETSPSTTSPMVISRVICTSLTEARMVLVRSFITSRFTPGGSQSQLRQDRADLVGRRTTFASGCLKMTRSTARLLLKRPACWRVLLRVDRVADIAQRHRRAIVLRDDDRLIFDRRGVADRCSR